MLQHHEGVDEDDGEYLPTLSHITVLQRDELTCMGSSTLGGGVAGRYGCFSSAHTEIDRSSEGDERSFIVYKRRRVEQNISQLAGEIVEESNRGQVVERPIPKLVTSLGELADSVHRQFLWLRRSRRSPTDIAQRLANDRRVGVYPSIACINEVVRNLFASQNIHSALDFIDELLATFPYDDAQHTLLDTDVVGEDNPRPLVTLLFSNNKTRQPIPLSTILLIIDSLCQERQFVVAAQVALFYNALQDSSLGDLTTDKTRACIPRTVWERMIDGLEEGPTSSVVGLAYSQNRSTAVGLVRDIFEVVLSGQVNNASTSRVLSERRILRHVEIELQQGEVFEALELLDREVLTAVHKHTDDLMAPTPLGNILSTAVLRACHELSTQCVSSWFASPIAPVIARIVLTAATRRASLAPNAMLTVIDAAVKTPDGAPFAIHVWLHLITSHLSEATSDFTCVVKATLRVVTAVCTATESSTTWTTFHGHFYHGCGADDFLRAIAQDVVVLEATHRSVAVALYRSFLAYCVRVAESSLTVSTTQAASFLSLSVDCLSRLLAIAPNESLRDAVIQVALLMARWTLDSDASLGRIVRNPRPSPLSEFDRTALSCVLDKEGTAAHASKLRLDAAYESPLDVLISKQCIPSPQAYLVLADAEALHWVASTPERRTAFSAMLSKYDASCGGRLLVPFDVLSGFSYSDEGDAKLLSWMGSLARTGATWLTILPYSLSLITINTQRGAGDSVLWTALQLRDEVKHPKVLLVSGSAARRARSQELQLKPVVAVEELLTKLGVK